MAAFISLEDSPMFQKENLLKSLDIFNGTLEVKSEGLKHLDADKWVFNVIDVHLRSPLDANKNMSFLEQMADELKGRCQRLHKDCKSFTVALGNASDADATFASSLEAFGAGQEDPVSVSIGGPVMSKFINAFRELATYKEFLRSQVEHVLMDQLVRFLDIDLQDVKESRKRFDKAVHAYDQSREKFVSLKKNTREDILEEVEEGLQNSKSAFDKSRFNLVSALMTVEAKKKYEFLESISAIMDAHLRYFKLGYDLFSRLEPFIHQVLSCAQQSKELANAEQDRMAKRIQEFRTQSGLDNARASSNIESSTSADGIHAIGTKCHKSIEALMQSSVDGEVQTIKQGYLLKRSSHYRGDWKRKFFVLDSQGSLYYYRNKGTKSMGSHQRSTSSAEQNSGVFARFRARHSRSASLGEKNLDCQIIDLHASTIKMDAEDADLRLCFRIISPLKTYTLQSENAADRADWVNKITGVITSLLNSHLLGQPLLGRSHQEAKELNRVASFGGRDSNGLQHLEDDFKPNAVSSVLKVLREVPGNALCAECTASDPDWASLNLGILLCIECSGVHRNLGVHISKVRSLTLDVKVWESTILDLFRSLGNSFCNSIWEGLLLENERTDESKTDKSDPVVPSIMKPSPKDDTHCKEKFIQAKYVEKSLVIKESSQPDISNHSSNIWLAVKENNLREVYRLIVVVGVNIVNTTFDKVVDVEQHHHVDEAEGDANLQSAMKRQNDPAACQRIKDTNDPVNCLQGCSLLHLACQCGNPVMLELLIQFSADINLQDFHGRTPLHHCIAKRDYPLAKLLLRRGASPSVKDAGGLSVMERAMEMGAITDEELFIMLVESQ